MMGSYFKDPSWRGIDPHKADVFEWGDVYCHMMTGSGPYYDTECIFFSPDLEQLEEPTKSIILLATSSRKSRPTASELIQNAYFINTPSECPSEPLNRLMKYLISTDAEISQETLSQRAEMVTLQKQTANLGEIKRLKEALVGLKAFLKGSSDGNSQNIPLQQSCSSQPVSSDEAEYLAQVSFYNNDHTVADPTLDNW